MVLAASLSPVYAQTWSAEQQEIWRLEEQQWKMAAAEDLTWIETMVHPDAVVWSNDWPGPNNRASMSRWNKYDAANGATSRAGALSALDHHHWQRRGRPLSLPGGERGPQERAGDRHRSLHRRVRQGRRQVALHHLGGRRRSEEVTLKR